MDEMLNETLNLTSNSSIINNISTSGDVFDDSEVLAYIAAEIIIAVFALFSNLFVFIAIIRFKNLQTPTFCLLASLSVADISVALLAIPSAIVLRIGLGLQISGQTTDTDHPVHQGTVCFPLCLAMVAFQLFATQVSIWGLLLIAIDRFVAIHFHLRYRAYITLYRVKVGIVVSWLGGSVIALGWESAVGASAENLHAVKRCAFEQVVSMEYMVYFNFVGCVLIPFIVMFALYLMIFRSAKKQLQKIYSDVAFHPRRRGASVLSYRTRTISNTVESSPTDEVLEETSFALTAAREAMKLSGNKNPNTLKSSLSVTEVSEQFYAIETTSNASVLKKIQNPRELFVSGSSRRSSNLLSSCDDFDSVAADVSARRLRRKSKLLWKEFTAARSLFTVIGLFALCWLPVHIINCITLYCPDCRRPDWLMDLAVLLSHANSMVNPVVYAFRLQEMKGALRKLLVKYMKTVTCK